MQDDIFIKLVEELERQGGELLAEAHNPMPIPYRDNSEEGKGKRTFCDSTGCFQETLVMIPFDQFDTDKEGVESGDPARAEIKLCAIDDRVDLWPRFAKALA